MVPGAPLAVRAPHSPETVCGTVPEIVPTPGLKQYECISNEVQRIPNSRCCVLLGTIWYLIVLFALDQREAGVAHERRGGDREDVPPPGR
jgi:hypothetical protein